MVVSRFLSLLGFVIIQYFATTAVSQTTSQTLAWYNASRFLRNITQAELRATDLQIDVRSKCSSESKEVVGKDLLNEIMREFKLTLHNNICALKGLKRVIEQEYNAWEAKPLNLANSSILCCGADGSYNVGEGCALLPLPVSNDSDVVRTPFIPQPVIQEFMRSARRTNKEIIYYAALSDGSLYMHPPSRNLDNTDVCEKYDPRLRPFYTQTKLPGAREMVIIVDRKENSCVKLLEEAVEKIFKTLHPTDKVALCLPNNNMCKTFHPSHKREKDWPSQNHPLGSLSFFGKTVVASDINKEKIISSFKKWLQQEFRTEKVDTVITNYTTTLASARDILKQDLSCKSCQLTKGEYCQFLVLVTPKDEYNSWNSSGMLDQIENSIKIVFRHFDVKKMQPMNNAEAKNTILLQGEERMFINDTEAKNASLTRDEEIRFMKDTEAKNASLFQGKEMPFMNDTEAKNTSLLQDEGMPFMKDTEAKNTNLLQGGEMPFMNETEAKNTSLLQDEEMPFMNDTEAKNTSLLQGEEMPFMNDTEAKNASLLQGEEMPFMNNTKGKHDSLFPGEDIQFMNDTEAKNTSSFQSEEIQFMNDIEAKNSSLLQGEEMAFMNDTEAKNASLLPDVPVDQASEIIPDLISDDSDLFCNRSVPDSPVVIMPYVDGFGMKYIMSICLPLTKGSEFFGAVCSDLSFINFEAKASVEGIKDAYVFMVNSLGFTLMHPLLPPSYGITKDLTYTSIYNLEQSASVEPILESMILESSRSQAETDDFTSETCKDIKEPEASQVKCSNIEGIDIKPVGQPSGSDIPGIVKVYNELLQYCWVPINNTGLAIALVLPQNATKEYLPFCKNYRPEESTDFKYYLQTDKTEKNCSHEALKKEGFVKFAPDCFIDVLSYILNEKSTIPAVNEIFSSEKPYQEVMRKDLYGSVELLKKAEHLWRTLESGTGSTYAKYMGTADGAFISFPGKYAQQSFDHRTSPWYRQAVSFLHRDFFAMTSPYCSEWGAPAMVYTITQTLYDHNDNPVAVVAGDVSFQYIIDWFKHHVPFCRTSICIIIDSLGYVVLKSDWGNTTTCEADSEIVAAHITRVAPDIAQDMISSNILQRKACHDYEDNLTFYYWSFALKGKDTVHEGSAYTVHKITQTSLFLTVRKTVARREKCNCQPFKRGKNLECHDTCALECECPCRAGTNTVPCHNADADVHKYPIPACKPLGPKPKTKVIASNCTTP